jgi:shikimate dehydrogenase
MNRYGLIGFPLSHSFSEKYFASKFLREGITDCVYQNFPIENIGDLYKLINETQDLKGLNVTIPHKEKVLPFLTDSNTIVKSIGACNCIKIKNGTLLGFNTDAIGFEKSLLAHLRPQHSKALILGEGGAAKAVSYVLEKLGIEYLYVVRRGTSGNGKILFNDLTDSLIASHTLIVNSTPIGTYPNVLECPPINYDVLSSSHYLYDLIYNPEKTMFLQKGEAKGTIIKNGYEMLLLQAEESWKIWTNDDVESV